MPGGKKRRTLDELKRDLPGFSFFSTTDGPNTSGVTAQKGTIGIEVGSSATTTFWGQTSSGTNNWTALE